ncbi:MAG TPA: glycosyltransferase [Vicinamibacterales bacterium]|nr:glycosyltransferase [Vicinamibacterales bacterium]
MAIFIDIFMPGGTQRQMIELLARLDRRRFLVHAVCFHRGGGWDERVAELGCPVAAFPIFGFRRPDTMRQLLRFARWCRANRIAVLQTCDVYSNIFGLPGGLLAGVPVRIGSRRGMVESAGLQRVQRLAYSAAHRVVANSQAAATRLRTEGLPARKTVVIPNGIDLDRFAERLPSARPRRILMVSVLREEKRGDVLVRAAPAVLARFPDAEFVVAGDGPCRAPLADLARDLGVADRFHFLGHRDDVVEVLAAADLFVLPSRSEASPNAVIEAMAAGLPVVASAAGGIVELVEDGRTGRLVPPGDAGALAAALCELMADPARAAAMGRAARALVAARHPMARMVAAFEELYLTELAARGARLARAA